MAVRLALLAHHYRADWEWDRPNSTSRRRASRALARGAGTGDAGLEDVRRRLDDDLDAPGALAALDDGPPGGRARRRRRRFRGQVAGRYPVTSD